MTPTSLQDTLHNRVIGQEEAVVAIAKAVRRARAGLQNPKRPIASFIFCGPTGAARAAARGVVGGWRHSCGFGGSSLVILRLVGC